MNLSIVTASMGELDLLRCFFGSLRMTTQTTEHQIRVCVGFDRDAFVVPDRLPLAWAEMTAGLSVDWTLAPRPGAMEATNAAFELAFTDWLVWVADDFVFLPGWDDIRIDGAFLTKDRMLSFELLEPYPGSFPPPVYAGRTPEEFDLKIAETAAFHRLLMCEARAIPKGFFGSAVFHRSRLILCPTWESDAGAAYSCGDISWIWSLYNAHPDLVWGKMPGNSLYHFGRQTISRHPERAWPGERTWLEFQKQYGLTIQEAWGLIYERSEYLWDA